MAGKRRWGQFLRARRLEIADALEAAHDQKFLRLVEELALNDEFEATVDRRARRTEAFMKRTYDAWIGKRRDPEPLAPRNLP